MMTATKRYSPLGDAYLGTVRPFALPVLEHLRGLVHEACPTVEETIKWSRPFFEYRGAILANMSAFKEHCTFGFWGVEMGAVLREARAVQPGAMGSLGRITLLADLPSDQQMAGWLRQATAFVDGGQYTSRMAARSKVVKAEKPVLEVPGELAAALKKNQQTATVFAAFSPSCKREYVEWIAEAKRPETRDKRIVSAMEWIADGKQRNWKYQS